MTDNIIPQNNVQTTVQNTKLLDDNYRNSITQFLKDNTVYDCLPKNSLIVVLDRNFSCYEAIDLIIENNYEECTIWNSDFAKFDGLITHSDIIKMILTFYENIVQKKQSLNKRYAKVNIENQLNSIEEQMDNYEEDKKLENEIKDEQQKIQEEEEQEEQQLQLEKQLENLSTDFNETNKQLMISELQKFQIRDWFRYISKGQTDGIELKSINLNASLQEACLSMKQNQIHRIFATDNDSQLIVGIINNHDILLLLLRNLTQEYNECEQQQNQVNLGQPSQNQDQQAQDQSNLDNQQKSQQQTQTLQSEYDLPISYLLENKKDYFQCPQSLPFDLSVYDIFYQMIYKLKVSSVPIVDGSSNFLGLIYRRDILFVWKEKNFQILQKPAGEFLQFVNNEKKKYKITSINIDIKFKQSDSIKDIVQRCVFVSDNKLILLDEKSNKLSNVIGLSDIFNYYLSNNQK